MESNKEKLSYAIGQQMGQGLAIDDIDIDTDQLFQGISDVLNEEEPKLTEEEMHETLQLFMAQAADEHLDIEDKNDEASTVFLEQNKTRDDVIALDTGLQYRIINEAEGDCPTYEDYVTVHYKGTLINGTEFDSSPGNTAATFPVKSVIPGWQDILEIMPVGSKWEVFIPPKLAYGEMGSGSTIGPNEALIFELELISIN